MSRLFIDTPHLVFQIHDTQADSALDFPGEDVRVLRELAQRYAEIAALPAQQAGKRRWQRLNDLEPERPLLWTNEVCWNEMDHDGSLRLRCANEVCQRIETELRRTIYQWEHFPGDMIVEPVFNSPLIIREQRLRHQPGGGCGGHRRNLRNRLPALPQPDQSEEDLEKIRPPQSATTRGVPASSWRPTSGCLKASCRCKNGDHRVSGSPHGTTSCSGWEPRRSSWGWPSGRSSCTRSSAG